MQQSCVTHPNFPVSHLTFQRCRHFPTLAPILLNDSNLVSLPTPSNSQLGPLFPPLLCDQGAVDTQSYSMVFKVVSRCLSEALPFFPLLAFTGHSSLSYPRGKVVQGAHNLKVGARFMQLVLTCFRMGLSKSAPGTRHTAIKPGEFEILEDP